MTVLDHTPVVAVPSGQVDEAWLLRCAARGDVASFLAFYDLAHGAAYCLALGRARLRGLDERAARAAAGDEVVRLFVHAFQVAGEQAGSGLSPLAWLLTLDVVTEAVPACA